MLAGTPATLFHHTAPARNPRHCALGGELGRQRHLCRKIFRYRVAKNAAATALTGASIGAKTCRTVAAGSIALGIGTTAIPVSVMAALPIGSYIWWS